MSSQTGFPDTPETAAKTGEPAVSVLVRCHNSARFIRSAILSALGQKTDFDFEVVVSDDSSDDETVSIVRGLQEEFRDRLHLVLRTDRVGYAANFFRTLARVRGRYVAVLDADDYWTRRDKLQLQFSALESNRRLSAIGHRYLRMPDADRVRRFGSVSPRQPSVILPGGFYRGAWIKHSTIMFRTSCAEDLPQWVATVPSEDIAMQAVCLRYGNMGFLNQCMAVCRTHNRGVVSSKTRQQRLQWSVESWKLIRPHAPVEYLAEVDTRIARMCFDLADEWRRDGLIEESVRFHREGISLARDTLRRRLKSHLRDTLIHWLVRRLRITASLRPVQPPVDPTRE